MASITPPSVRHGANIASQLRLAQQHRRLVMDVYEQVLKPLDASRVDEFFRPDFIQHSPMARTGADGLKTFLEWAKSVSPSAEHHVKRLFVMGIT